MSAHALFVSKNLIGDALNISPAWRAWWALHKGKEQRIDLLTNPDQIAELYAVMGVPANIITTISQEQALKSNRYDFVFNFDVARAFHLGIRNKIHIAQAYAHMLGVSIDSVKPVCVLDDVAYSGQESEKGCILLSPFSESCSSRKGLPPNKMLPVASWIPIIDYLRTFDRAIYVLGSARDKPIPEFSLPENHYLLGARSLTEVARIMRERAAIIVTVDNGMSHLAASQELPTFLFYPSCLPVDWIVPRGNPHCSPMQLDPASCPPERILHVAREVIPRLLKIKGDALL